ncbi:MAG TPA: biotin--[acetyl-CoA-carboxylase] ligase [Candidatus Dormibacteraeota bacterium]|nr:biotin--[acetyl-CoA-carboxylase] ligase [Candidatus Dormibacteraeota bacterium]
MRGAARPLLVAGATAFPGFSFRWISRTPSTQDLVRAAARAGAPAGHLVAAGEQTAGRGRQGRRWEAPPGGALLASILLRPRASAEGVPLAAGLAVTDAIAHLGVDARLKWPNDVLAGGGKLAGILAEVEPAAPGLGVAVVLGIGVNLRIDAFPEGVAGASLHRLLAPSPPPTPEELLAVLLPALAARLRALEGGGIGALLPDWRARAVGLGGPVVAETPGGRVEGRAVDIDADGALLVETAAGTVRLLAGDAHFIQER